MKQWRKWAVRAVCLLVLPLVLACAAGYWSSRLSLNFCRELIPCGDGYAGIQEGQITTRIFFSDGPGSMTGQLLALNLDLSGPQVRSFEQLFRDGEGTL